MIQFKICSKCKKTKTATNFVKSSRNKSGLYSSCKECQNKLIKTIKTCSICNQNWQATKKAKNCFKCSRQAHNLNENYFETPTIENSYWAGFIAADGCITKGELKISISKKDIVLLEQFKNVLKFSGRILKEKVHNKHPKSEPMVTIRFMNAKIIHDLLVNFKISPRKSLTLQPPMLDYPLALAYIKGYIDGDGSFYIRGKDKMLILSIRGTVQVLDWIKMYFSTVTNSKIIISNNHPQWSVGGSKAKQIGKLIKNSTHFGLERKWNHV